MQSEDPMIWGARKRLAELAILGTSETPIDQELVGLRTAPSLLLVTDRRVLFLPRSV